MLRKKSVGESRVDCPRIRVIDRRHVDQKTWAEQMEDKGVGYWQSNGDHSMGLWWGHNLKELSENMHHETWIYVCNSMLKSMNFALRKSQQRHNNLVKIKFVCISTENSDPTRFQVFSYYQHQWKRPCTQYFLRLWGVLKRGEWRICGLCEDLNIFLLLVIMFE